jgi:exopolysaccharide biosynthesis polyprenyl glycosylphosphotransferase
MRFSRRVGSLAEKDFAAEPEHLTRPTGDERTAPLDAREPESAPLGPPAPARPARRGLQPLIQQILIRRWLAPAAAAACCAALSPEPLTGLLLALLTFGLAVAMLPVRPPWLGLLPFMRVPVRLLVPLVGTASLGIVLAVTELPNISGFELLVVGASAALVEALAQRLVRYRRRKPAPHRTAVIGSNGSAVRLARELKLSRMDDYSVIGRVETAPDPVGEPSEAKVLGTLAGLHQLVEEHGIDLLVMASEAPRAAVFEEISKSCLHLPVRLWELSSMYEETFGHVPVAEIHAAWFQYILHPHYRADGRALKRAIDLMGASVIGLLTLPMMVVVAWVISRDGGPVLFKQYRVGEGGRPILIRKLRTMRYEQSPATRWAGDEDERITAVGRILRALHIDELPQLWNIFQGDMSLVGPRPEQPAFVARLEDAIPFYQRRHLVKPGLTGWAQIRCGYAGSDAGSAWKLSHDLYYLKHRSTLFDLAILAETVRTVLVGRSLPIEMKWVPFIHGSEKVASGQPSVPGVLERACTPPADSPERRLSGVRTASVHAAPGQVKETSRRPDGEVSDFVRSEGWSPPGRMEPPPEPATGGSRCSAHRPF